MPYSQFTLSKVKENFYLTMVEGTRFLPPLIEPILPNSRLQIILVVIDQELIQRGIPHKDIVLGF